MLAFAAAWQLVGGVAGILRMLAGGVLAIAGTVLAYEGVSIPLPLLPDLQVIDGRVPRVRAEEQAACRARIAASVDAARRVDAATGDLRLRSALEEAREAAAREIAAAERDEEYADETQALPPAIRQCRGATARDVERLR